VNDSIARGGRLARERHGINDNRPSGNPGVPMSKITASDIEALVDLFERSDWEALQLEMSGVWLDLSKRMDHRPPPAMHAPSPAPALAPLAHGAAHGAAPPTVKHERAIPTGWVAASAPNLGTFYRAPKPGAPPFVEIGQEVRADTEICLLEVMKLFTAVSAGVDGIVREILVVDGEMVEHGQPLMLIEPRQ
jgi:acetyl-CoA carboxylase biotin carboxyl carrier protein